MGERSPKIFASEEKATTVFHTKFNKVISTGKVLGSLQVKV